MSSATSIDQAADPGLRPWQFFVLAGMLAATAVVVVATGQSPASIIVLSLTVVSTSLVAVGAHRMLSPLVVLESVDVPVMVAGRTRAALEREKTLVLRSIKELEFDFAMGKVARGDFDEVGGRLRARAMGLLRQLDESGGYRAAIEQELHARRRSIDPDSAAQAHGAKTPPSETACPACEGANDADARFCKHCGQKLAIA
jgi:hypothetical protein